MLREQGVEPKIVEYLKTPPDREELGRLLTLMDLTPRQLLRSREKEYKELGLADRDLPDSELLKAMVEHPRLIERPIVVSSDGTRAALGRPTERVLGIL